MLQHQSSLKTFSKMRSLFNDAYDHVYYVDEVLHDNLNKEQEERLCKEGAELLRQILAYFVDDPRDSDKNVKLFMPKYHKQCHDIAQKMLTSLKQLDPFLQFPKYAPNQKHRYSEERNTEEAGD